MINVSFGWDVFKMPFILLAFLVTLTRLATSKGYLDKKNHHMILCFAMEITLFLICKQGHVGSEAC